MGDKVEARLQLLAKLETAIRAMRHILEPAVGGAALESERRLKAAPSTFEDLDSLASQVTDLHSWRLVHEELELRAAQARMGFGESLQHALTEAGVPWSGSFPSYWIRNSVRLDIDTVRGTARIGRRVLPLGDVNDIVRRVNLVRKAPQRATTGGDFEQELGAAYAAAAEAAGVLPGNYVSIGKVYEALRRRMPRGYSRERFANDLFNVWDKTRFEFAASRHPRHGIRVPPGEGTIVGSLRPLRS
jgi:hypothetical protein